MDLATSLDRVARLHMPDNCTIPASDSSSFHSALSRRTSSAESLTRSPDATIGLPVRPSPTRPPPVRSPGDLSEPSPPPAVFRKPPGWDGPYVDWDKLITGLKTSVKQKQLSKRGHFLDALAVKYSSRVMGHDRIEIIYAQYMEEKNAWMIRNGISTATWFEYRKLRMDEYRKANATAFRARKKDPDKADEHRWACFPPSGDYDGRPHTPKFLRYYRRVGPSKGFPELYFLCFPERRRDGDGKITSEDPGWTPEEQQAYYDFIRLQKHRERSREGTDEDTEYLSDLKSFGVIDSTHDLHGQGSHGPNNTLWVKYQRIVEAKEAERRTKEITLWDDTGLWQKEELESLDLETLNYSLERWSIYVNTGKFPG